MEQNTGTIYASNLEHLLVFKSLQGDNQEHNKGMLHDPEQLLDFKAPWKRETDHLILGLMRGLETNVKHTHTYIHIHMDIATI